MQLDLRIAVWNANGLVNHLEELKVFLSSNNIDICLVSETHFTSKSYFKIHGYDFVNCDHPDGKAHGGAAIIIKSCIKFETLKEVREKYLQAACIKVKSLVFDFNICAIYFPPRFNVKSDSFEKFFNDLGPRFLVAGDFNAKHPWWGSRLTNPKGKELYSCIKK